MLNKNLRVGHLRKFFQLYTIGASLTAQLVKNLPAVQETLVRLLSGRSAGEEIGTPVFLGFPCGSPSKDSSCNVGDLGAIRGLGRSPGEGKGNLLQYYGLENSMGSRVHGVAKSRTRLRDFHFTPLSVTLAVGLSYMAFIILRYISLYPHFLKSFYCKWMLNFIKRFLSVYGNDHMVFSLQFVIVEYHIDWFADMEEFLHPWNKFHLLMVCDPFKILMESVC